MHQLTGTLSGTHEDRLPICTIVPDLCARIAGSTAVVTSMTPNTLVSNCSLNFSDLWTVKAGRIVLRKAAHPPSSKMAFTPIPALLTQTSIRPHTVTAWSTTDLIALYPLVTSSSNVRIRSVKGKSPSSLERVRAVAITLSPRARAERTRRLPRPDEVPDTKKRYYSAKINRCYMPVMSHTRDDGEDIQVIKIGPWNHLVYI